MATGRHSIIEGEPIQDNIDLLGSATLDSITEQHNKAHRKIKQSYAITIQNKRITNLGSEPKFDFPHRFRL